MYIDTIILDSIPFLPSQVKFSCVVFRKKWLNFDNAQIRGGMETRHLLYNFCIETFDNFHYTHNFLFSEERNEHCTLISNRTICRHVCHKRRRTVPTVSEGLGLAPYNASLLLPHHTLVLLAKHGPNSMSQFLSI